MQLFHYRRVTLGMGNEEGGPKAPLRRNPMGIHRSNPVKDLAVDQECDDAHDHAHRDHQHSQLIETHLSTSSRRLGPVATPGEHRQPTDALGEGAERGRELNGAHSQPSPQSPILVPDVMTANR